MLKVVRREITPLLFLLTDFYLSSKWGTELEWKKDMGKKLI